MPGLQNAYFHVGRTFLCGIFLLILPGTLQRSVGECPAYKKHTPSYKSCRARMPDLQKTYTFLLILPGTLQRSAGECLACNRLCIDSHSINGYG